MISKYKTSNLLRSKVDYFFLLVYCIFHSLPRSTVFVFYIKNHQFATVNHIPIPRLVCSFRMYIFIRVVHIDFVIVCSIALHIKIECLRRIWHTQSKSAVIISINSLQTMKINVEALSKKDNVKPSSNFVTLVNNLATYSTTWIEVINSKL